MTRHVAERRGSPLPCLRALSSGQTQALACTRAQRAHPGLCSAALRLPALPAQVTPLHSEAADDADLCRRATAPCAAGAAAAAAAAHSHPG